MTASSGRRNKWAASTAPACRLLWSRGSTDSWRHGAVEVESSCGVENALTARPDEISHLIRVWSKYSSISLALHERDEATALCRMMIIMPCRTISTVVVSACTGSSPCVYKVQFQSASYCRAVDLVTTVRTLHCSRPWRTLLTGLGPSNSSIAVHDG